MFHNGIFGMRGCVEIVLCIGILAGSLTASVIYLTDGEIYRGDIVRSDGTNAMVRTGRGDITVPVTDIKRIAEDASVEADIFLENRYRPKERLGQFRFEYQPVVPISRSGYSRIMIGDESYYLESAVGTFGHVFSLAAKQKISRLFGLFVADRYCTVENIRGENALTYRKDASAKNVFNLGVLFDVIGGYQQNCYRRKPERTVQWDMMLNVSLVNESLSVGRYLFDYTNGNSVAANRWTNEFRANPMYFGFSYGSDVEIPLAQWCILECGAFVNWFYHHSTISLFTTNGQTEYTNLAVYPLITAECGVSFVPLDSLRSFEIGISVSGLVSFLPEQGGYALYSETLARLPDILISAGIRCSWKWGEFYEW